MSAPRTTSRANGEPDRINVGTALPPLLARELASRRAREAHPAQDGWDEPDRPRHERSDPFGAGESPRPVGAGAVAVAGLVFVVCAVVAAVAVLWPREDGGGAIEASGVTTTESPFEDVADRGTAGGAAVPAPSTTGSTAAPAAGGSGQGDGGSSEPGGSSEAPSPAPSGPPPSEAPPSTEPDPAPTTTTSPAPQPQNPPAHRPGDPDDAATWDALAQCESNGNWSADPGNGRYGGLMIDDDTWDDFGGDGRPHRHSRETQISIARRIQDDRGWDYWDDCADRLDFD